MEFFRSNSFSSQVRHLMGQHHIPGLSIAIVQDDEVASAGYGYASLDPEKPCTADTLFDIASCSKSMTAAAVALLVEDNEKYPEVQWEATMSSLLPEDFVMPDPEDTKRVTVDDVLSHMTGMADNEAALMGSRSSSQDTPRSITRNLRHLPMAHALRAKWEYCNIMYSAAAHLVAEKSGMSFSDFLESRVFRPLDMASTSLQCSRAEAKGLGDRLARGHEWIAQQQQEKGEGKGEGEGRYVDFPQITETEGEGAGCVVTSARDFIKWVAALLHPHHNNPHHHHPHHHPISPRVYRGLTRLRAITNTDPSAKGAAGRRRLESPEMYAAGLETYWYRGYAVVGHYGKVPGFGSRFFFVPEARFGAAFAANSARAEGAITALSRQLIDAVLDLPPVPRVWPLVGGKEKEMGTLGSAQGGVAVRAKNQSVGRAGSMPDETPEESRRNGSEPKNEESKDQATTVAGNAQARKSKKPRQNEKKEKKPRPQTKPLSDYVGKYWHPGYRRMTVSIKDDRLFIDGMDRSYYGMTMWFEHVANQTKYTAHLSFVNESFVGKIRAEFVFDESGRAVKMGLKLEEALKHLIWFELEKDT